MLGHRSHDKSKNIAIFVVQKYKIVMTVNPQNKHSKKSPYKGLLEEHELHTPEERKKNTERLKKIHQQNLQKLQKQ